jgi:hypothetical protein
MPTKATEVPPSSGWKGLADRVPGEPSADVEGEPAKGRKDTFAINPDH